MDAYVDTSADVNLISKNRYVKLHNDDRLRHIMPSDIKLGVWGDDQIALLGKCNIYLVHPDTKKPVKVTFYVADKSGSTLLSCATSLKLDLIKLHPGLDVPPPRAKIITSQADWTSPAAKRATQGKVVFDEMQSTVQEPSVKPLTALFRCLLQPRTGALFKRTIGHRKTSQVSKCSAWWTEFNGTKISPIWLPHVGPVQASYGPIQKTLTAPCRSPIQRRTISHRKMSQVSKWSAQRAEFNGTKISPIQPPHAGPMQASYGPVQNPLTAPCRSPVQRRMVNHTETRQVSKWSACQDECSDTKINPVWLPHMGPIQNPLTASYGPIQRR